MSPAAAKRLSPMGWIVQPLLLSLVGVVLFALPMRPFGLPLPEPVIPMVLAFAWAIIRPSIVAPAALLLAGLFLDLTWGGRLGIWALVLLAAYGATLAMRRTAAGRGPVFLAGLYLVVTGCAMAGAWAFSALLTGRAPTLLGLLGQYVPTALLFPAAYVLIARFEDADVRFR